MKAPAAFALRQKIGRALANKDFDAALNLIRRGVERINDEPLCAAHLFGDASLDGYCQEIGAQALSAAPPVPQAITVYLVSKLQKSGGHTRVLLDLIRAAPAASHAVVLSTEIDGRSDREAIANRLAGTDTVFEWCGETTMLARLRWLQVRLNALAPSTVWLFNHHQDSAMIAAVQPGRGYRTLFYHHADHHLTLGLYLAFATHIDPHPMGLDNCCNNLGLPHNHYLPLWVADAGTREADKPFMRNGTLMTATVANANKVEVPYSVSYAAMVPEIIRTTGGVHLHIGKLTPPTLFRIKRGLRKVGIDARRFVYVPNVTDVARELLAHNVDLYIGSFPYGGARTLIEAMGAGLPVVVHDHYATRLLGGMDMAYPEAFAWRRPEDLLFHLKNITPEHLAQQSRAARAHFLKYHDARLFTPFDVERLDNLPAPPPLRPHIPDPLEWGYDVIRQMSFYGVLWRFLYRNRRIMRALAARFGR